MVRLVVVAGLGEGVQFVLEVGHGGLRTSISSTVTVARREVRFLMGGAFGVPQSTRPQSWQW